jgi:CubicO group peptidase (beta-lactamase class C family)
VIKLLLAAVVITTVGDGLPSKAPKAVGMSATRLQAIDRILARGIKEGGYPGAAVVVGRKGAAVWEKGFGTLSWSKTSGKVDPGETVYDLASLTKVVGTTTALMILFDEGKIDLEAPVTKYLPAFTGGYKDSVTIRHLLTHRSGLPAGRDLWRVARNPQEARLMVIDAPLTCKPGTCYIYSDLGADILGMVVETVSGMGLDQFLGERVFGPLGMTSTYFRPDDSLRTNIAPTEVMPPRGYPLQGEVHDENAYALGGVAGHAGLFSTAKDLSVFAQMMLNGGVYDSVRIVSDTTVALFTKRAAGSRALGWDTADGDGGAGRYLTERAYGHTGYTGTSLWIDPDREMFVILLTNRVHAAKARRPATVISDVRADLADAAVLAVIDGPEGVRAMPASFRSDKAVGWNRAAPSPRRSVRRPTSSRSRSASSARSAKSSTAKKPATTAAKSSGTSAAKPAAAKPAPAKAPTTPAAKPAASKASTTTASPGKAPPGSPDAS